METSTRLSSVLTILALTVGSQSQAQCDGPLFSPEVIGDTVLASVALADLDGDGDLDMALGGESPSNDLGFSWSCVTIQINEGAAGFAPGQQLGRFETESFGRARVAAADVDGDGDADLIVASDTEADWQPARVHIRLNEGDATFTDGGVYDLSDHLPGLPACLDIDGDDDIDIAVPMEGSYGLGHGSEVAILLNDGSGTFAVAQSVDVGVGPRCISPSDFDQDGAVDLAVACGAGAEVWLLMGDGDGTFSAEPPISMPADYVGALVAGDLDEDGHADLAVAYDPDSGSNNRVGILLGEGDGTFTQGTVIVVPPGTGWLTLGDLNSDSHDDLAVANVGDYEHQASVFFGSGDGAFALDASYRVGGRPRHVVVGDIDGDEDQDLVTGHWWAQPSSAAILLNVGDGTFADQSRYNVGGSERTVGLDDLDGDGDVDLVVGADTAMLSTLLNDGEGVLSLASSSAVGDQPRLLKIGNLNGDGVPDVALIDEDVSVQTLFGVGDGSFGDLNTYSDLDEPIDLALCDLNGDGLDDLVVLADPGPYAHVFVNQGDGTFGAITWVIATEVQHVVALHLDDDDDLDLVFAGAYLEYVIALNNGDGTFVDPVTYLYDGIGNGDLARLATGDMDGDDDLDVIITTYFYDDDDPADDPWVLVSTLLNMGDGTLQASGQFELPASSHVSPLAVGDFDGDGDTDVCAVNSLSHSDLRPNRVNILLNAGDGTLTMRRQYLAGNESWEAQSADLDGNGATDLVIANANSSDISVFMGQCSNACSGDLDGDGHTDQADLGVLLSAYGNDDGGDLDGDGDTDQADLGILLSDYGCEP